ncbi:flagellar biosynthesis protein FlhF [Paenibacillus sp. P26]|nr:flagellar biosynthesis protein FlhF [Paenibacillus sp. P26]
MRVKRYVVESMPDALQKIRTDLGKDAVILNTKEVRSGGFLGLFSKKKIEVIAATDSAAQAESAAPPKPVLKPARACLRDRYGPGKSRRPGVCRRPGRQAQLSRGTGCAASGDGFSHSCQDGFPASILGKEDRPLEEIKQMKEMMNKLAKHHPLQMPVDPVLEKLEARLRDQEVEPQLIQESLGRIAEEAEGAGEPITEAFALGSARRFLGEILTSERPKAISRETRIAHFVGPTGVGKTTTIAKLAAEQVLKHQRKVGFITSDTYRIAAVEQLKTYATILNVPLEVVFSPLDLGKAFEQLKDRDLIFMDTAGRNFRNEMYVSELNALLQSRGQSETFLVLSLTTKYKDMKAITDNFSKFKLDKVLFTKMDETDSYGAIVNLIREYGIQTSYIADGQSVPDDIAELNEQRILDLMLEGKQDE